MENITKSTIQGKQEALIRLERNYEAIQRLSLKISSYTHEPRCATHFERHHQLKDGFKDFDQHHRRLVDRLQSKRGGLSGELEKEVLLHMERYRKLESEIADYLLSTGENP